MATFVPRLTRGNIYDANNPYYRTYNSFPYDYNTGMPNCTSFCYGRWNEISLVTSNPYWGFHGNGGDWYNEGVAAGYQHSTSWNPQVGALISWSGTGAGHVAVVEQVIYDANNNPVSIVTSNSIYRREYGADEKTDGCAPNFAWEDPTTGVQSGPLAGFPFFYTDTINANDPNESASLLIYYGNFNGFIYHPDFPPDVPPTPPTPASKMNPVWVVSLPNRIRRQGLWL